MTDMTLLDGTADDVRAGIVGMAAVQLAALLTAEQAGKTRKGVITMIEDAIAATPATAVVIDPAALATFDALHPALDPGPAVSATPTQNAREMNPPSVAGNVPYSGVSLEVTKVEDVPAVNASGYTGAKLLTTQQEAALRAPTGSEIITEY